MGAVRRGICGFVNSRTSEPIDMPGCKIASADERGIETKPVFRTVSG